MGSDLPIILLECTVFQKHRLILNIKIEDFYVGIVSVGVNVGVVSVSQSTYA